MNVHGEMGQPCGIPTLTLKLGVVTLGNMTELLIF